MRDQVYQPTTTTLPHDRSKTWMPSFLAQSSSGSLWSRTLVLILSVMFAVMGLVMIIVGAISYQSLDEGTVKEVNSTAYVIILCLGVLLELVAIITVVFYMRNMGYNIPCCPGKIARIRKRLHENQMMVNGQMVSTGEPISAQYCPPSHPGVGNTPPPPYTDVSEEQHLMEEKIDIGSFWTLNCWIEGEVVAYPTIPAPFASTDTLSPSLLANSSLDVQTQQGNDTDGLVS